MIFFENHEFLISFVHLCVNPPLGTHLFVETTRVDATNAGGFTSFNTNG